MMEATMQINKSDEIQSQDPYFMNRYLRLGDMHAT